MVFTAVACETVGRYRRRREVRVQASWYRPFPVAAPSCTSVRGRELNLEPPRASNSDDSSLSSSQSGPAIAPSGMKVKSISHTTQNSPFAGRENTRRVRARKVVVGVSAGSPADGCYPAEAENVPRNGSGVLLRARRRRLRGRKLEPLPIAYSSRVRSTRQALAQEHRLRRTSR